MGREVILMGFIKRLPELVSNRQGQLSTTDATTLIALLVSSVVILMCAYWDHSPDVVLGLYLGAWVAHAGVQKYHDRMVDDDMPPGQQGGKDDERGAD